MRNSPQIISRHLVLKDPRIPKNAGKLFRDYRTIKFATTFATPPRMSTPRTPSKIRRSSSPNLADAGPPAIRELVYFSDASGLVSDRIRLAPKIIRKLVGSYEVRDYRYEISREGFHPRRGLAPRQGAPGEKPPAPRIRRKFCHMARVFYRIAFLLWITRIVLGIDCENVAGDFVWSTPILQYFPNDISSAVLYGGICAPEVRRSRLSLARRGWTLPNAFQHIIAIVIMGALPLIRYDYSREDSAALDEPDTHAACPGIQTDRHQSWAGTCAVGECRPRCLSSTILRQRHRLGLESLRRALVLG